MVLPVTSVYTFIQGDANGYQIAAVVRMKVKWKEFRASNKIRIEIRENELSSCIVYSREESEQE